MDGMQPQQKRNKNTVALVVTAIVVVVACTFIIVPIFANEGWPASRVSCLSNLKRVGQATAIYSSDNNDTIPSHFSFDGPESHDKFVNEIMSYVKNKELFLCPKEQKDMKEKAQSPNLEGISGKIDYVHCLSLRGVIPEFSTGQRLLVLTKTDNPATTPYLRDPIRGYGIDKYTNVNSFLSPHGSGFNTTFLDAHAKYVRNPSINSDL